MAWFNVLVRCVVRFGGYCGLLALLTYQPFAHATTTDAQAMSYCESTRQGYASPDAFYCWDDGLGTVFLLRTADDSQTGTTWRYTEVSTPTCSYYSVQSPESVGDCPSICYETDAGTQCSVYDEQLWDGYQCGPLGDGVICQNPTESNLCLSGDQPGLYSNDTCYSSDAECVYLNGKFSCLEPKEDGENCGYFDDEYVCVDFNGSLIPSDSPDHPQNGGNADGDITNDGDSGAGKGASDGANDGATDTDNKSTGDGVYVEITNCVDSVDEFGNKTQECSTTGSETIETDYGDVSIPGVGENQFYKPDGKTAMSVLGDFKRDIEQLPIVQGVTGFFDVQVSGTCPVWSTPAIWVFDPIVIDAQCSQAMENIWPGIAAIIIATAAFLAFRVAVL